MRGKRGKKITKKNSKSKYGTYTGPGHSGGASCLKMADGRIPFAGWQKSEADNGEIAIFSANLRA